MQESVRVHVSSGSLQCLWFGIHLVASGYNLAVPWVYVMYETHYFLKRETVFGHEWQFWWWSWGAQPATSQDLTDLKQGGATVAHHRRLPECSRGFIHLPHWI